MTAHTISVGDVEITSLSDGYIRFPTDNFFPSVPAERWEEYRDELTADGKLELNVGSFLYAPRTRHTRGHRHRRGLLRLRRAQSGLLPQALSDVGVSAADVDAVVMTHLHVDHVGWNVAARRTARRRYSPTRATTWRGRTGAPSPAWPA